MLSGPTRVSPIRRQHIDARAAGAAAALARRALAVTCAIAVAGLMAPVAGAQPVLTAPKQIIGPEQGVISLDGAVVARDGTGGIVYLANPGGGVHVFVSRLVGGVFQPPQQVDSGLPQPSSQPVITGTNGGELMVAFVNAGTLYVTEATSANAQFSAPAAVAGSAGNPSLQMNPFGEAYLAFTDAVAGGSNVDVEYFDTQRWMQASPFAMNGTPDGSGIGPGAPSVAVAGDGVAIVAWGDGGHVYSRRVWGPMTSVQQETLDPGGISGWGETASDSPVAAVGGDSSYPDIAFREQVSSNGQTQSRVLLSHLIAESIEPAVRADGLSTPGSASARDPGLAMNEYGRGFATAETVGSNQVYATTIDSNGKPGATVRIDSGFNLAAPDPVPALAGLISTFIAWQQTQTPGSDSIVLRYAQDGSHLGAQQTASSAAQGPTDAAAGLVAGGDTNGDALVAWVQGAPGQLTIDTAQLYQPPGAPTPTTTPSEYSTNPQPALTWTAAREAWGPLTYTIVMDGNAVGQTTSTTWTPPSPLLDGPHNWYVEATNPAGQTSTSGNTSVFVDSQPPSLRIRLTGQPRVGHTVALLLAYLDPPNPTEPGAQASGIASVTVSWSRRAPLITTSAATIVRHVFEHAGLYPLTVTATDKAGNATRIHSWLRVLPAPMTAQAPATGKTGAVRIRHVRAPRGRSGRS